MIREIYGKKIGMTQIFSEEGHLLTATLVEVNPVYLLEKVDYPNKLKAKIGCFEVDDKKKSKLKKPLMGYFNKLQLKPFKLIREVELEPDKPSDDKEETKEAKENSRQIGIEIFKEGEKVDVRAKTKGKGFAGGMKRYGWSGQPSSHGSTMHRRIGSVGASAYPSKIIKGLHMPGHMGNCFRTTKNLAILKIDKDKNILFLKGSIPGSRGSLVRIRKRK
jgi:large subunit ribosomal protein L3